MKRVGYFIAVTLIAAPILLMWLAQFVTAAMTSSQQADALFKAALGVANSAPAKQFYEQPTPAYPTVIPTAIWQQADQIPAIAPALADQQTSGVVKKWVDLTLTLVPGSTQSYTNAALATAIPFNYGDGTSYNYTIKDSTGAVIPFGTNDWVLQNGVLTFYGGAPANMPPKITFYQYVGTTGLARGYDGRSIPPLFVSISGGARVHTYDKTGANPIPAPWPYKVKVYNGSTPVTPLRVAWRTGPAPRLLSGTGTAATFTPALFGKYSANKANNSVCVLATYSTTTVLGGKRMEEDCIPVPTILQAPDGIQGPPGQDANVTEPAIITAMSTTASGNPLVLRATSDTDSKFEVWDTNNNTVVWVDGKGNQYWKMPNGDTVVKVLTDGSFYVLRGGVQRVKISNDSGITQYHTDGTTVAFRVLSGGRYYGKEGLPPSNGMCTATDTNGAKYYVSCGGGGGSPGGSNKQLQYNNNGSFAGAAFARYSLWANGQGGTLIVTGGIIAK